MKLQELLSADIGGRCFFVHPPEPPADALMDAPVDSAYLARTKVLGVPFNWSFKKLVNPHIAVVGISGSGKSFLVKTLITRANLVWGTGAVIIDWTGEYAEWVRQAGGKVVALGANGSLNLLDLAGTTPINRVKQVMRALALLSGFENAAQERLVEEAIEKAYEKKKFVLHETANLKPPTLKDAKKILEKRLKRAGEEKRDVEGAIHNLKQYTEKGADYFSRESTLKLDELVSSNLACIDLSGLSDEASRSLAGLSILQLIREKMRCEEWSAERRLKLFVVLDEAWKICQEQDGKESDPIAIAREGRKYAFGLIVATQNPTDVSKKIFSNVGTVFVMRTKYAEYIDYLQDSLRFSRHMRDEITGLGVGECVTSLTFDSRTRFADVFALKRIEGEELLEECRLEGKGMEVGFEKAEFRKKMLECGLTEEQWNELERQFKENDGLQTAAAFTAFVERCGIKRQNVTCFFREAGLDDETISRIYHSSTKTKQTKELEVED